MKVPQRKNHKSMSGEELLKKASEQAYGKPVSNMLSILKVEKDEC